MSENQNKRISAMLHFYFKKSLTNTTCLSSILRCFFLLFLSFGLQSVSAKGPVLSTKKLQSPPPRIIRTCCSFGVKVSLFRLPIKITEITSVEKIGLHQYMGNAKEKNGIVYTHKGGFIDLGHVRDQADWTAYLYTQILQHQSTGEWTQKIGYEGGTKELKIQISQDLTEEDIVQLAGKIAYDLSVWHEISTWFGASTIPLVPERYSSFSVEDAYSNLLGARLGMKALKSDLPYPEAMTQLIAQTLEELEAVETTEETEAAMEVVREIWWSGKKALPNRNVLIARELNVYPRVYPWLIPQQNTLVEGRLLSVPQTNHLGKNLSDFYQFSIKLNYKFPFKKIFPNRRNRVITQMDFDTLLRYAEQELNDSKRAWLSQAEI
ncbi:MAG: DUF4056 domain-containing protein [Chitinophagales bacterium]